ncbi:glycosyltransferase family 4 protein [Urechidicola croceus]|uniref:Glycosyl transferase family 1 n=1 Tax=Urechidicola croceus TaxID=1850246 RepID=A0A1D8P4L8_9FLAO|nr:glycosyltransferase family 4 protein [Urechidicola croceus]AOW19515.1 hypothetical protein LPB138_01940 [Urechidicola croceus]
MHIVFLTNEYPEKGESHGGIGSFVQNLSKNLVEKGFNISVIGISKSASTLEYDNGVEIHRIQQSTAKFGKFIFNSKRVRNTLKNIHEKKSIDIVEGSELSFAFLPKNTPYKKVIRMHGGHHFFAITLNKKPAVWRSFQERRSFKKADYYVSVSNYVGSQTKKYLKKNFEFTTIYNSVNTDKFVSKDNYKTIKDSLLFVGTICEKKGIRQLVQAIPIIKSKFPDVKLKIVGRDWKFPNGKSYTEYLKTFITESIKDNVEIIGVIPHDRISKYIEEAEICVYPSHMEAMPIAWLEGLLMGKPIVASNIGPAREAIKNNKTGLLANPHSPEDLAMKILELLLNKEKALKLGREARNDISKRFNQKNIIEQNINFYTSII